MRSRRTECEASRSRGRRQGRQRPQFCRLRGILSDGTCFLDQSCVAGAGWNLAGRRAGIMVHARLVQRIDRFCARAVAETAIIAVKHQFTVAHRVRRIDGRRSSVIQFISMRTRE